MQVQNIDQNQQKAVSMSDFLHQMRRTKVTQRKYYTQIQIIADYIDQIVNFSLDFLSDKRNFKHEIVKRQVDQESFTIQIKIQYKESQMMTKILIVQMDRIIKIFISVLNWQTKKYDNKDSFWFDYGIFLNQKVGNVYRLGCLREFSGKEKRQLGSLVISRMFLVMEEGLKSLGASIMNEQRMITHTDSLGFFNPNYTTPQRGKLFYSALTSSQNSFKIGTYLDIKSITRLSVASKFTRQYIFRQPKQFYKFLYQYSFGVTGFQLNQLDWGKLLNKKRTQLIQAKKPVKKHEVGRNVFHIQ